MSENNGDGSKAPIEKMKCAVCGGTKEEHGSDIRHAFTITPGELLTPEQRARQQGGQQGMAPQVVRLGGAQTNEALALNRLLETLLGKEVINAEEALYVVTGMKAPQLASGFADPAAIMGGGR